MHLQHTLMLLHFLFTLLIFQHSRLCNLIYYQRSFLSMVWPTLNSTLHLILRKLPIVLNCLNHTSRLSASRLWLWFFSKVTFFSFSIFKHSPINHNIDGAGRILKWSLIWNFNYARLLGFRQELLLNLQSFNPNLLLRLITTVDKCINGLFIFCDTH